MRVAVACAAGSWRGAFVHGALKALADHRVPVQAYAGASSSAIPAAFAAAGRLELLEGAEYWKRSLRSVEEHGSDISASILAGITVVRPLLVGLLFRPSAARYLVAVSAVLGTEAAVVTQGDGARRLGQRLVIATRTRDNSWAAANLRAELFDSRPSEADRRLTPENFGDALYASTRMLHAWKTPAAIDGQPYVDASYTCACPAVEMAERGFDLVLAVSPEPGSLYRDFFRSAVVPAESNGAAIVVLQPEESLGALGVNFLDATEEGVEKAFALGVRAAESCLRNRCAALLGT